MGNADKIVGARNWRTLQIWWEEFYIACLKHLLWYLIIFKCVANYLIVIEMLNGIVQFKYSRSLDVALVFAWLVNLGTDWLTVEPDVSDLVGLVYLSSLIKSPTVCYWRLRLSEDRNYQRICLFEDRKRKVSILNEPMLLPIHVECLYKWRIYLKTMFVRGSKTLSMF